MTAADNCNDRRALCGWSPPDLPADTAAKRVADRVMPRTGIASVTYFAVVIGLLLLAPLFPTRAELVTEGVAALAAGAWCGVNFWRCRHAHCVVTATGWLGLSMFVFVEAALGRSLIAGYEQPVFLAVLVVSLLFEGAWYISRGSNAIGRTRTGAST